MEPRKQAILDALDAFVNQRPGMDPHNYGDWKSYRSESRSITRDLHNYRTLRRAVAWRDSITAEDLKAAFRAYSGRLTCKVEWHQYDAATCPGAPCGDCCDHRGAPYRVTLDYCTGQYFPTEYRKAACAVLASALWDRKREDMPAPRGKLTRTRGPFTTEHDNIEGMTPGDWMRRSFRREFGAALQRRYFD